MLDLKKIRENYEDVKKGLQRRGADLSLLDNVVALDKERRRLITETEQLKSKRNTVSKQIGQLKKKGEDTTQIQKEMRELGELIAEKDHLAKDVNDKLRQLLLRIPNIPHSSTPDGLTEEDNKIIKVVSKPKDFSFKPLDHIDIGNKLGILDFARGAKIAGSGFPLLSGIGAKLQRALIQFMLDMHTEKHGYKEILPPFLANASSMTGTGQLPKMAEDMYYIQADNLYLIPTAEVPVTNYYRDEIISEPLPVYLTAYTPCFRREAGAAGKDTKGMKRVHQFDKVEMVKFVKPETSYDELEKLLSNAEAVLSALNLHYRILSLCAGDISFAAAKCYDIELWAPGSNSWLEVSSCSNFEDFQARRANIRFRDDNGKPAFVHTLNGSGVALPRVMIAILENYQNEDGSVSIPDVLTPYMGGITKINPV